MGYAMASNIRKKLSSTSTLVVFDVNEAATKKFSQEFSGYGSIEIVSSAREVAEKSHTLISIVPSSANVKEVYLNPDSGVIAASRNHHRLMVECSTIDVRSTRDVEEKLRAAEIGTYLDTPVSGGVPGATAATLSFLIGASTDDEIFDKALRDRLHDLLAMMGEPRKFFYCGQVGNGLIAKICNNYLAGVNLLAAAEAMNIGIRSGIDRKLLYDVIRHSSGQSFMFDHVHPAPGAADQAPSNRGYSGGFKTQLMVKDMSLGVHAGQAQGVRTTMASAALGVYEEAAVDPRCIDKDVSVVYRFLDGPE